MANGKQIKPVAKELIHHLSLDPLPDCRVIGHIFSLPFIISPLTVTVFPVQNQLGVSDLVFQANPSMFSLLVLSQHQLLQDHLGLNPDRHIFIK